MDEFIKRHASSVCGLLHGWDRLLLRGTLRALYSSDVMLSFLWAAKVLLKDFGAYVKATSLRVKEAACARAAAAGRPVVYLASSAVRKEQVAREIMERDRIQAGLIALLNCVEPCWAYRICGNRETKRLELRLEERKCLHVYRYQVHPVFGFMHTRLQTWFPFQIQVCLNGREWLARQMNAAGLAYERRENCFTRLADVSRAQELMAAQLRVAWPRLLNDLARESHPLRAQIFKAYPQNYYWTVRESEYATDVMFKTPAALARLYPPLVHYGITALSSGDVMRFLGRRVPQSGRVDGRFEGEATSDIKTRPEGVRLLHRLGKNSIKMYDKQAQVLRVETTINEPADFKQFRRPEGQKRAAPRWLPMRRGIADLHRRAEVSRNANERYLQALAVADQPETLKDLAGELCRPVQWQRRRARALNPLAAEDAQLLQAVNRGEFLINGFRNRDLRPHLFKAEVADAVQAKRQAAAVTRNLRLLRAHGLIQKVAHTHRYKLTAKGRLATAAVLKARECSVSLLTKGVA